MAKRVVISEFMDAPAVAMLAAAFAVEYDPKLVDEPQRLAAGIADADALIVRNRTQVRGALLAAGARLHVVGRLGVGLDNIDVEACRARGIEVIPATGANALAVAEYVVATAMLLLRGAYLATAEVAAGKWPRERLSAGREVSGKTLGLVGFGSIGQLTAKLAHAVGMRVLACDPAVPANAATWQTHGATPKELDALLAESDAVSLHVPLVASTRNLLDGPRIARMRQGAVLINTARGGIVDEQALAHALSEGCLAGAAIDVFESEPLQPGSPLADAPNVILTPHIAGLTQESNTRVSTLIAERVAASLRAAG